MKVHNVHSREIAAAPERVGALLDSLGSDEDRLWPTERWRALPFELDGPLAVGAAAHHGPIAYAVEEYESGRRVVFRFAPGLGLDGTHRLDVEPLGADAARLTHALDCRIERKMITRWPIVRGYHDALIEDLLDQAETAAAGRHLRPRRWPLWLRIANGVEVRAGRLARRFPAIKVAPAGALTERERRMSRIGGVLVPGLLVAIAALHAAWALGWRWPGGSDRELAERVVAAGAELPSAELTWVVAGLLLVAAGAVRAGAGGAGGRVRVAAWGVAGVLVARGLFYIPIDLANGLDDIYDRLDLAIYSPLCLALGAGTAWLLTRGSGEVHGRRAEVVGAGHGVQ